MTEYLEILGLLVKPNSVSLFICYVRPNDFISTAFDLFSKIVELGRNRAILKNIYKQH